MRTPLPFLKKALKISFTLSSELMGKFFEVPTTTGWLSTTIFEANLSPSLITPASMLSVYTSVGATGARSCSPRIVELTLRSASIHGV